MKRKEAVAHPQLPDFDWPQPEANAGDYTEKQLAQAQADIASYDRTDARYNVTLGIAIPCAWVLVEQRGCAPTRLTYEICKLSLYLDHNREFHGRSSNLATTMARRMAEADPSLIPFLDMRHSAVDVVLAREGKRDA